MANVEVKLISFTDNPINTVWKIWMESKAVNDYSNVPHDEKLELLKKLFEMDVPVIESIYFTFLIKNVSISWREQAVRHRIGTKVGNEVGIDTIPEFNSSSFWSQSLRIKSMSEFYENKEYRIPESISNNKEALNIYRNAMSTIQYSYSMLVDKCGISFEDARELIPLGATANITWTLNLKALKHITRKRSCFTGDTVVPLINGKRMTMEQLYEKYGTDKEFYVYSCDKDGNIVPGKAKSNGKVKKVKSIMEITYDNGMKDRATEDQLFKLRNGEYKRADELKVGISLMPLYTRISNGKTRKARDKIVGYEEVYNPGDGNWYFTHRIVANKCVVNDDDAKATIHHMNQVKLNNDPTNLVWMSNSEHMSIHARLRLGTHMSDENKKYLSNIPKWKRVLAGKIAYRKGVLVNNLQKARLVNISDSEISRERKRKISEKLKIYCSSDDVRKKRSENAKKQWADKEIRKKMIDGLERCKLEGKRNHKIIKIELIETDEWVYDLSVEEYHNHALGSGVFVHNCFILQSSLWHPVIAGMIGQVKNKVSSSIADLLKEPPCISCGKFKECAYKEENVRRLQGDDCLPVCPMYLYHNTENKIDLEYRQTDERFFKMVIEESLNHTVIDEADVENFTNKLRSDLLTFSSHWRTLIYKK